MLRLSLTYGDIEEQDIEQKDDDFIISDDL